MNLKRIFDFVCSTLGLILLSPLFFLIAFMIKWTSPESIFFKHDRIGKNFRPFKVIKFRTMVQNSSEGPPITGANDPRITLLGKILRKWKLDELPQLLNVLKGEMSLVGPRPEVKKYVEMFKKEYEIILQVLPGLTDWSSLVFVNEEQLLAGPHPEKKYGEIILPQKLKLQIDYVRQHSFWTDLKIIFQTILKVIGLSGPSTRL